MILLHMEYKPSELAEDLGIDVRAIYKRYLPAGAPHRRDENGLIWIVGTEFREWLEEHIKDRKGKPASTMAEDEAYCMRCRKWTRFSEGWQVLRQLERLSAVGTCSECGARMRKYVKEKS